MLALGDGVAAESEIVRARQAGVRRRSDARISSPKRACSRATPRARCARRRAPRRRMSLMPPGSRGAPRMALGDVGNAAHRASTARSPPAPNDSEVWTDIGRFRRATGDLAGAIQAADRAVAAGPRNVEALALRGELTRGQYGLAAAIPWFDRRARGRSRQCRRLARARRHLWRHGPDARHARRRPQGPPASPAAIRALIICEAVLAARARNFPLARRLWNRTNGAYDETPAGMLLLGAIDFETGNEEQAARRLGRLWSGASRAIAAPAGCSPPPSGG